jgi:hypothetical protein
MAQKKTPHPEATGNGANNDVSASHLSHTHNENASPLARRLARVFAVSPHLAADLARLFGGLA